MPSYNQFLALSFLLRLGGCLPAAGSPGTIRVDTPAEPGPCEWDSIEGFVDKVLSESLNVTDVVLQCPDTCSLVYGSGNPDISGPGVMISYYSQFGFTVIYCMVLPAFAYIVSNTGLKDSKAPNVVYFLRACQGAVNEINVFYGLTILISAAVRSYTQTPPVVETIFMYNLFRFQLMILGVFIISSPYDVTLNNLPPLRNEVLYNIGKMALGILTGLDGGVKMRENAVPVFSEVCKLCHSRYGYYDASAFVKSQHSLAELAKYFGIGVLIAIAVPGFIIYYSFSDLFKGPRATLSGWWEQRMPQAPRSLQALKTKALQHMHPLSGLLTATMFLIAMISQLVTLETSKEATRGSSGADDNQWGYGQTMAVLLWFPILKVAVKTLFEMALYTDLKPTVDQGKDGLKTTTTPLPDAAAQPPPSTEDDHSEELRREIRAIVSRHMDLAVNGAATSMDTSSPQAAQPPSAI